ncbi:xylose isomerase [Rhizomicrobium electricum]|uniref:Xylose isomerase n=1 Tax=Rhizomicrobium electricum TaxID=480070 RepID=A0ABN1ETR5_9PROT|nr:xylose isomerase [Rhizomicrobium electricum]NIJ49685.1 xylose isomerase [Rhizomicrobium electricum]
MSIFSEVGPIKYEGPDSTNPLAYKVYDKDRVVLGKKLGDWLRLTVAYWHSFSSFGSDMFGGGTWNRPWSGKVTQEQAEARADAAFDFFTRLGTPYFAFHDADVIADASSLPEHIDNLKKMEDIFAKKMSQTGVKLLWGTANAFSHPRYAAGAATNPDPEVFAYAAGQVRAIMETTHRLGGENYVLWGGREGYDTLLNTDLKAELAHFGRFLNMVVEHKHKIGFKGTILIEPKPFEPTKHQYDRDTATVFGFLQKNGLEKEVKVNIEVNHATLANLDFEHEVEMAYALGIMGSLDINRGDPRSGWDTDQFPNNAQDLSVAFLPILENGGLGTGGCNFDAKLRRQSVDVNDLYIAHVAGIDTLARAVISAEAMIKDKRLADAKAARYAGWSTPFGKDIMEGKYSLADLADVALKKNLNPKPVSGKQELLESVVAQCQKIS